ncbi:MAG: 16S rRNA (cytidine(1402)-2'-O)-methyltransferase [Thermodesulfovibrionales bacterium]|nr:16S rRNA (cytidine(1402)-2'-O)-methyltransferase [Thermodesulfovibrionales bacterium]
MKSFKEGQLFIVATPIGNLEDITLRALRILKEVDFIAVEDTQHSQKLLNHYNISKPLISYWSEKEKTKADKIIEKIKSGQSCALISDAGTPGISDPGYLLIQKAIAEGISIIPVPGPCGAIAALSVSGLPTKEFSFIGFLPAKRSERLKKLHELSFEKRTIIFYEAPHRLIESLSDLLEVLGDRAAVVAKELTKLYEEVIRGNISDLIKELETKKISGEFIIIISGKEKEFKNTKSLDEAIKEVKILMKKGLSRKEAVRKVSMDYTLSRRDLYEKSIAD